MTKLLEKAIERARELPDEMQDAVALALLTMAEASAEPEDLDEAITCYSQRERRFGRRKDA